MKREITHEELVALLCYDKNSGSFTRRCAGGKWGQIPAGATVGTVDDMGYLRITLGRGRRYRAHRLAWFYVTGDWPKQDIDHIDGNRLNNAFCNLRDVPRHINTQNRRALNPVNKSSGLIGAVWSSAAQRWTSRIRIGGGKFIDLGLFNSAEAAHGAYVKSKRQLHEGNTL